VWQENLKAEMMEKRDYIFIVMASSGPEIHALEVLICFFYAAAERLHSQQDPSDSAERKISALQQGFSSPSEELLESGLVKTKEDAKIIVFLPFLRRGLLPSKPPKEETSGDKDEEEGQSVSDDEEEV